MSEGRMAGKDGTYTSVKDRFESEHGNCLFRYRSIDAGGNNLQAFAQNRLYFSTPENFNDPYDMLLFADSNKIVSDILMRVTLDPKYRGKNLNNLAESIYKYITGAKILVRKNMKVICFSKVYDSMLMWSHYADCHRGYCLVYDMDGFKDAACYTADGEESNDDVYLWDVEYSDKQIDLTDDLGKVAYILLKLVEFEDTTLETDGVISDKLPLAVFQKSKEWSYEREWRMVAKMKDIEEPSSIQYIECKPTGIILGAKCSDAHANQLIDIASKQQIHVYRMFLDEFDPSYKLNIGEGIGAKIV